MQSTVSISHISFFVLLFLLFVQNASEGDENQTTAEQIDNTLDSIPEAQPETECNNQEIMQGDLDASQSSITVDDATDVIDATNITDTIDAVVEMDTIDATDTGSDGGFVHRIEHQIEAVTDLPVTDLPVTEIVASDSSSLPAIADDLLNGCSQDTKVDIELDAEMVSEDELPAPAQPTIDDAEDLSDEELPGPKRAELPADTEVVSEDEFPSSNKVKRKADECHEADNPNEDVDTPKKRAKTELDSKHYDAIYPLKWSIDI